MSYRYLRQVYNNGKLEKQEIVYLPVDIGHWKQSIALDSTAGFKSLYRTELSPNKKTRYVCFSKAIDLHSKYEYYYTLLDFESSYLRKLKAYQKKVQNVNKK